MSEHEQVLLSTSRDECKIVVVAVPGWVHAVVVTLEKVCGLWHRWTGCWIMDYAFRLEDRHSRRFEAPITRDQADSFRTWRDATDGRSTFWVKPGTE